MKGNTEIANTEYRKNSKLLIDELSNLISLGKLKAYSNDGNALMFSDVNKILSETVLVKEAGSKKLNERPRRRAARYLKTMPTVYLNAKRCTLSEALGHEHTS
jgi:hypothetical protein